MPGYLGKSECHQCGREVDVSENRSGMAYYRCAPCGFRAQQSNPRGQRMQLDKVRPFEDPDAAPAAKTDEPEPRESREIPATIPAPAKPATAAKSRAASGFFFGGK